MANYVVSDTNLSNIANAIRNKGGTYNPLSFPTGFINAIDDIPTGGGDVEAFIVSFYYDPIEDYWSADKTFSEVWEALDTLQPVMGRTYINDEVVGSPQLAYWGYWDDYGEIYFKEINVTQVGGHDALEYKEYVINSDDGVESWSKYFSLTEIST